MPTKSVQIESTLLPKWEILIVNIDHAITRFNKLLTQEKTVDTICQLHYLKTAIYHDRCELRMINDTTGIFN